MRSATVSLVIGLVLGWLPASAAAQERRGDFAAGWVFTHDVVNLPIGIAVSDAYRVKPKIDVVFEGQYDHGTVGGTNVGFNIWGLMGGIRGSGSSSYGKNVAAFGQVLAGVVGASASVGINRAGLSGFGLQPGFGVEVPLTPSFAIRPQFDLILAHLGGSWGKDPRFGVHAVFVLKK